MLIKSKYKIARRLGPQIFEKTQTQKYAIRAGQKRFEGSRGQTDFGKALLEKQKARFTYLINERQFKNYAKAAISEKKKKPDAVLFGLLELRVDSVVYRLGLVKTRLAARQAVSHGHITVNGKRVTVSSYRVSIGDTVGVMARSQKSKLFVDVAERAKEYNAPNWLTFDSSKLEGKVKSKPSYAPAELAFDVATILDFYKR